LLSLSVFKKNASAIKRVIVVGTQADKNDEEDIKDWYTVIVPEIHNVLGGDPGHIVTASCKFTAKKRGVNDLDQFVNALNTLRNKAKPMTFTPIHTTKLFNLLWCYLDVSEEQLLNLAGQMFKERKQLKTKLKNAHLEEENRKLMEEMKRLKEKLVAIQDRVADVRPTATAPRQWELLSNEQKNHLQNLMPKDNVKTRKLLHLVQDETGWVIGDCEKVVDYLLLGGAQESTPTTQTQEIPADLMKYKKMLSYGVTEISVKQKMETDGFDPNLFDQYISGNRSSSSASYVPVKRTPRPNALLDAIKKGGANNLKATTQSNETRQPMNRSNSLVDELKKGVKLRKASDRGNSAPQLDRNQSIVDAIKSGVKLKPSASRIMKPKVAPENQSLRELHKILKTRRNLLDDAEEEEEDTDSDWADEEN